MRDEQESLGGPAANALTGVMRRGGQVTVDLRVLATTDIHMQLLGFDYARDRHTAHAGFAGLATLIKTARAEARAQRRACVLFDNGDLLQGAALDQTLAQMPVTENHPIVACLNHLEYDGYGVGNHDLDHGLDYLNNIASHLAAPMVSSNLRIQQPGAITNSALITVLVPPDADGLNQPLKIGLVSALPEETAKWSARELQGKAHVAPILPSIEQAVYDVRQQGADIVVLLAHLGVERAQHEAPYKDDARLLADVAGVDTIILGHTHRRLPGRDHTGYDGVDVAKGTLGRRPSAMAGFDASDLAVLDLKLVRDAEASWQVSGHDSQLRANAVHVPADPTIVKICEPAHQKTRRQLASRCGRVDRALHNFFSLARPTAPCALVANAKWQVIRDGIADLPEADLPLLAAASAHTAGGRGGPSHYLSIPKGPVLGRHMAALSPYENGIWGLRVTGTDLRQWLENAASVYNRLCPQMPKQTLLRSARPAFDFDTIYGLTYQIDPTQAEGNRIWQLAYQGQPVGPSQVFMLATNNFRAAGGGGGRRFDDDQVVFRSSKPVPRALHEIMDSSAFAFDLETRPWRFSPSLGVDAVLRTSPEALAHLDDIADLAPRSCGLDAAGFARIQLTL